MCVCEAFAFIHSGVHSSGINDARLRKIVKSLMRTKKEV